MKTPRLGAKVFLNNMTDGTLIAISSAQTRGNYYIDVRHNNGQVWRYEMNVKSISQGVQTKTYYVDNAVHVRKVS